MRFLSAPRADFFDEFRGSFPPDGGVHLEEAAVEVERLFRV